MEHLTAQGLKDLAQRQAPPYNREWAEGLPGADTHWLVNEPLADWTAEQLQELGQYEGRLVMGRFAIAGVEDVLAALYPAEFWQQVTWITSREWDGEPQELPLHEGLVRGREAEHLAWIVAGSPVAEVAPEPAQPKRKRKPRG